MKHATVARPEPTMRLPDLFDMRRWFDTVPNWLAPYDTIRVEEELRDDAYVVRAEAPGIDVDALGAVTRIRRLATYLERRADQALALTAGGWWWHRDEPGGLSPVAHAVVPNGFRSSVTGLPFREYGPVASETRESAAPRADADDQIGSDTL